MTEPGAGTTGERLWQLLPAVYRLRDAEAGGVLAGLLDIVGDQLDVLAEELAQLYDDQFVETAAPWATPYIGGVVGYRPIHGVVPEVVSPRAEVANTVAYRRRKGTAAVIEALARDVTGWPARVYESFERLTTTQYLNHTRAHAIASAGLRDHEALHHIWQQGAAFDDLAHVAHTRPITSTWRERPGRYGIVKVPIFLWRTQPVAVQRSPVTPDPSADGRRFRFDPLGADTRLFTQPRIETDITHLAEPPDVPQPLSVRWAVDHAPAVYGPTMSRARRSILLERQPGGGDPVPIPLGTVRFADLADVPGGGGAWAHEPAAGDVHIDPALGRVWFGDALGADERVLATFSIGMAVPVGAGNHRRGHEPLPEPRRAVSGGGALQPQLDLSRDAGTVLIVDSERYAQNVTITSLTPDPAAGDDAAVCLAADDGARPSIELTAPLVLAMEPRSTVVLDGLLISGAPVVLDEVNPPDRERRTIVIRDTTLVPGITRTTAGEPSSPTRASLIVLDPFAIVRIERQRRGVDRRGRGHNRRDRRLSRGRLVARRRRDHGARRAIPAHGGLRRRLGGRRWHCGSRRPRHQCVDNRRRGALHPTGCLELALPRDARRGRCEAPSGPRRTQAAGVRAVLVPARGLAHRTAVPLRASARRPARGAARIAAALRLDALRRLRLPAASRGDSGPRPPGRRR